MRTSQLKVLDKIAVENWLLQHIPHRICAALAGSESMAGDWKMPLSPAISGDRFHMCCLCRAIDEVQRVAMRWLIELVGVAGTDPKTGLPNLPRELPGTVTLEMLGARSLNRSKPEAAVLSKVWKGCSQATGHPTTNTNHPPIGDQQMATALGIVIQHLESALYAPHGVRLFDIVHAKT